MRLVNSETLQLYKRLLVYARPYYKALGLGSLLAALSAATEPLLQAMQLVSRPLAEPWARRRLMVATGIGVRADDPAIQGLLAFLREPSQKTKAKV